MSHDPRTPKPRSAFTLVELLATFAVIAALLAILLPAVQSSRATARRVVCLNNLKQIGIGLHNYEQAKGAFPQARDANWWSWLAHTLPQMEEGAIANQIDFRLSARDSEQNGLMAGQLIATFLCAADPDNREPSRPPQFDEDLEEFHGAYGDGAKSCGCCGGEDEFYYATAYAFTNYLGVSGIRGNRQPKRYLGLGMFPSSGFEDQLGPVVTLQRVADGTSKTLFVGERPVARFDDYEDDRYDLGWWATGHGWEPAPYGRADYILDSMHGLKPGRASASRVENGTHWWSYHPGGAQFLFVDGSARLLEYDVDHSLLLALSTRAGNEVQEP